MRGSSHANDEFFESPDIEIGAIMRQLTQTNPKMRIDAQKTNKTGSWQGKAEDGVI